MLIFASGLLFKHENRKSLSSKASISHAIKGICQITVGAGFACPNVTTNRAVDVFGRADPAPTSKWKSRGFQSLKLRKFIVWPMIFARNLHCNRKNIWLRIRRPNIGTNPTVWVMLRLWLFMCRMWWESDWGQLSFMVSVPKPYVLGTETVCFWYGNRMVWGRRT